MREPSGRSCGGREAGTGERPLGSLHLGFRDAQEDVGVKLVVLPDQKVGPHFTIDFFEGVFAYRGEDLAQGNAKLVAPVLHEIFEFEEPVPGH